MHSPDVVGVRAPAGVAQDCGLLGVHPAVGACETPDGGCLGVSWCRGDGGRRGRHEDVVRSCRACASRTWVVRLDRCVDVVASAHEQDGDVKGHTGRRTASRSCGDTRRTASRSCGDTHFHGRRRRMFPRRQQMRWTQKSNNDSRTEALSCVLHVTILCAVVASRRQQKRRRASVEQVVRARNEGWHGVPWCLYSRMKRCGVSGRRLARWTPDFDLVCVARFSPCGQRLGSVCMTVSMLS